MSLPGVCPVTPCHSAHHFVIKALELDSVGREDDSRVASHTLGGLGH